jgi:glycosyltransferase involved in cell wall biosynthesis
MTKKQVELLKTPISISEQQWPEEVAPKLSICCAAYNHASFIKDAIEGFLRQETTFRVEILIHDDASTDGTADLVEAYSKRYPFLIRSVCQSENQYSQGKKPSRFFKSEARGEFMALCEADDYWLDPWKLQRQVDALLEDQRLSMVFHNAWVRHSQSDKDFFLNRGMVDRRFGLKEITLRNWFIPTASIVCRREYYEFPKCLQFSRGGDVVLHRMMALRGDIMFLDGICSVWRKHPEGMSYQWAVDSKVKNTELTPNLFWVVYVFGREFGGDALQEVTSKRLNILVKRIARSVLEAENKSGFIEGNPDKAHQELQVRVTDILIKERPAVLGNSKNLGGDLDPMCSDACHSVLEDARRAWLQARCEKAATNGNLPSLLGALRGRTDLVTSWRGRLCGLFAKCVLRMCGIGRGR